MRISKVIENLKYALETYGDMEVSIMDDEHRNINFTEKIGTKLNEDVLIIISQGEDDYKKNISSLMEKP